MVNRSVRSNGGLSEVGGKCGFFMVSNTKAVQKCSPFSDCLNLERFPYSAASLPQSDVHFYPPLSLCV